MMTLSDRLVRAAGQLTALVVLSGFTQCTVQPAGPAPVAAPPAAASGSKCSCTCGAPAQGDTCFNNTQDTTNKWEPTDCTKETEIKPPDKSCADVAKHMGRDGGSSCTRTSLGGNVFDNAGKSQVVCDDVPPPVTEGCLEDTRAAANKCFKLLPGSISNSSFE